MILRDRVLEVFSKAFGGTPAVVAQGPGRVNLIGEHTDYNEGFALPFAIDLCTVAALRPRADRRVRLVTDFVSGVVEADLDAIQNVDGLGWARYPLGVVWAMGEVADLARKPGFDVAFASDLPVGAGLSSSAAIESAIAVALNVAWELGLSRQALAKVGQRAENVVVGAPTGILDQSASLFGEPDSAVLLDCRSLVTESVALGFDECGMAVLVTDTRVSHAHVDGGYRARREACERAAAILGVRALRDLEFTDLVGAQSQLDATTFKRVRHVVTENQRVLDAVEALRGSGPVGLGPIFAESHASMRDDFEISTPELDLAVDAAIAAGALGARMTGGGFGGSAIALVPVDRVQHVRAAVLTAFRVAGFSEPAVLTVRAVAGARQLA